jgi:ABC-type Co2+ transport system permease subunit
MNIDMAIAVILIAVGWLVVLPAIVFFIVKMHQEDKRKALEMSNKRLP